MISPRIHLIDKSCGMTLIYWKYRRKLLTNQDILSSEKLMVSAGLL